MSPPTFKRVEKANPLLYGGEQGHIAREPVGWVTQLFQRALLTMPPPRWGGCSGSCLFCGRLEPELNISSLRAQGPLMPPAPWRLLAWHRCIHSSCSWLHQEQWAPGNAEQERHLIPCSWRKVLEFRPEGGGSLPGLGAEFQALGTVDVTGPRICPRSSSI